MPSRKFKTVEDRQEWEAQTVSGLKEAEAKVAPFFTFKTGSGFAAVDAQMSTTAYRLLLYLNCLYPFGTRYEEMPNQSELAVRLGVSRQSINSAQAQLEAAGLWSFKIDRWRGRNLTATTPEENHPSEPGEGQNNSTGCQKNQTPGQNNSTGCQNILTPQPPEPAPSGHSGTSLDLFKRLDPLKEREREPGASPSGKETLARESFAQSVPTPAEPIASQPQPEAVQEGQSSAAPEPKIFDWENFDWARYEQAGDGGSCPQFWGYTWQKVEEFDRKQREKGEPGVGDLHAYTLGCIRRHGADRYRAYLISLGQLPSPEKPKPPAGKPAAAPAPEPGHNGAWREFKAEPQQFVPLPDPDEMFRTRKEYFDAYYQQGKDQKFKELADRILSHGDRPGLERLLAYYPGWEIRGNAVHRVQVQQAQPVVGAKP